jgi:tungstate transport system substrate-binding protein
MQAVAGRSLSFLVLIVSLLLAALLVSACSGKDELILATTTSTQDSGLLDVLIPTFEDEYGYTVKTIAVGSGQALRLGEEGEADVILAHSPKAEEEFMDAGNGESRQIVMHNDFIIVGPADDPAGVSGTETAADALSRIADSGAIFISRGDESGTHSKELSLWETAGIEPAGERWHQETGQGMGATLGIASEKQGYTLADRGTYLAQENDHDLDLLFEGDPALFNIYHVIVVNPEEHSEVNAEAARDFAAFIIAAETQEVIRNFGVDTYGEPLFIPEALVEGGTATPSP